MGDLVQCSLRAAPGQRLGAGRVEPVFQHVEVKRAQVFAAVNLQFRDDGVEFINLVMRQDVGLQLRGAADGVAVDFQHVGQRHGIRRWVEIADVGEQKAQRVADAAVSIDDAGQNLVVDPEVARVVGRGAPQADDFRAHLAADFLWGDDVADAFAHLVALAIDREAVREQAFVRRVVVHGAGGQQR